MKCPRPYLVRELLLLYSLHIKTSGFFYSEVDVAYYYNYNSSSELFPCFTCLVLSYKNCMSLKMCFLLSILDMEWLVSTVAEGDTGRTEMLNTQTIESNCTK